MIQLDETLREMVDGYVAILTDLQARHRLVSSGALRLAAVTVTGMPPDRAVKALDAAATVLRRSGSWWGPLATPFRFVVGGILVRRGIDPERAARSLARTLERFREHHLPEGGYSPAIAAFLLVSGLGGEPADEVLVERLEAILEAWRPDPAVVTGPEDLPLAALHALRDDAPEAVAARVWSIREALEDRGLKKGEQIQLAARLLALGSWDAGEAAEAMVRMADAARANRIRPRRGLYDEAALLALSGGDPDELTHSVATVRDALIRWRIGRTRLFGAVTLGEEQVLSIATGLVLLSRVAELERLRGGAEAAALIAARTALEAQQAAAVAAASTIASTPSRS